MQTLADRQKEMALLFFRCRRCVQKVGFKGSVAHWSQESCPSADVAVLGAWLYPLPCHVHANSLPTLLVGEVCGEPCCETRDAGCRWPFLLPRGSRVSALLRTILVLLEAARSGKLFIYRISRTTATALYPRRTRRINLQLRIGVPSLSSVQNARDIDVSFSSTMFRTRTSYLLSPKVSFAFLLPDCSTYIQCHVRR